MAPLLIQLSSYIDSAILTQEYAGNSVEAYLNALGLFLLIVILLRIFKFIIINRLKEWAKKSKTEFDDAIVDALGNISWGFFVLVAIYASAQILILPSILDIALVYLLVIGVTYYAVLAIQKVIQFIAKHIIQKRQKEDPNTDVSVIELLSHVIQYSLWGIAFLAVLSNLGFDITPMVAGLGIGGIAIAFALQNVLVDVFASFSIYFDKPFKKGDFIVVGTDAGVVERIGIKSTRVRTLQGQELVISNKELTEVRVHNYKKMKERRIVFTFGILYETPLKKVKEVPLMIREIINGFEIARLDRSHFKALGPSSLDFEVVYFVKSSDFNIYMDTQQQINQKIIERFKKEKIEFAYPTQTLYVNKVR